MTHKQFVRAVEELILYACGLGGAGVGIVVATWLQDTTKILIAVGFAVILSLLVRKAMYEVLSGRS